MQLKKKKKKDIELEGCSRLNPHLLGDENKREELISSRAIVSSPF